jgi:iron complex outermembrane receptor protein
MGRSFRIATVDEVYSQFGGPSFDAIVTLLEPQTSREQEVGLEYRVNDLRLRASAFRMDLDNEIYFFFPTSSNINLPPTRREGVELDASLRAGPTLFFFGNVSATRARFRYVGRQYYDNDQTNSFPDRMPAYATADLKLTHSVRNLSLSAAVNNLLNKHYYSYAIRNSAGTSFNAYPQPGRTLLASAEYRF